MWMTRMSALVLGAFLNLSGAMAQEATLTLSFGKEQRVLAANELLARPDATDITIPDDVAYQRSMTYRAVPLLSLLGPLNPSFDTIEVRATDGFVSQIPVRLIKSAASVGAVPWLAIEDPANRWPVLPNKPRSPAPFYLVWQNPELSGIVRQQWPYAIASVTGVLPPERRWPQLTVAATLRATSPARRGLPVFIKHCFACHKLKGAGDATVGPDLGAPMNPLEYMTRKGFKMLIRNPAAVRNWPGQKMGGFDRKILPDKDLDDLVAYLAYKARAK
jgi:mono/diheme cytochrome c family protein